MTNLITPTKNVSSTGDQKIDGLFSGTAWDGTITYAFPTTSSSYADDGADLYYEKYYSFSPISSQQQSLALYFMEQSYGSAANDGFSVEGFTNANFEAGSANTATVRFAQTSDPYLETAGAYLPAAGERGGDIWFGTGYAGTEDDYRFPRFGNYAGQVLAHELGHALGLKHAHEGGTVVPSAYDSLEYTIMTYHTFIGDDERGAKYEHDGAPQTFMMLDIAALQEMYGADYTTNSGDTVYKWNPNQGITYVNGVAAITPAANRIFATIWDGGGIDTYDLSAYTTALKIDLRAGGYSVFSQSQLADLGGGPNNGYARGNIFNALLYHDNVASLIENVRAGSGNDTIVGNEADNALWGNAGNDTLTGDSGNDTLDGGAGIDKMSGGTGNDVYIVDNANDAVIENVDEGTDTVRTTGSYTLSTNVENLVYIGTFGFSGTGNTGANVITGGTGIDWLDGKAGADTLIGGAGNDTYIVDDLGDVVVEAADSGADTIRTDLAAYSLADNANVEDLYFAGSGNSTGVGNSLDNIITGGTGDDTLSGGAGNDTLSGDWGDDSLAGGIGYDIYVVYGDGDTVIENADEGIDTVKTYLASYTLSANVENLINFGRTAFTGTGNNLNNTITGGAVIDILSGGAGDDTLDGGAGADRLIGGTGNDTYIVDNASDVVTEVANEGIDTVRTTLASYTLGSDVENLTYMGAVAFTGTGNDLANTIRGAAGADTLDGKAGADILIGGAGDDTYIVDNLADVVTERPNEGADLVKTTLSSYALTNNVEKLTFIGTGDFAGTGNGLANTINGSAGNDTLDGGAGNDVLDGGAGNDIYVLDSASDVIKEAVSAGTDEIRTALAAYSIAALVNVENLTYTGSANFTGTGNAFANTITGGGGNDLLNGGGGADTLIGGAGSDIYIVDHVGDIVTEAADEGADTVRTALASYTLGSDLENLTYIGTVAFTGTGNDLANTIRGAAGADTLDGKAGADSLIGGAGNDTYIVDDVGDVVTEGLNAGTDLIKTALSIYTLASNVENLLYTGSASFTGTGNTLVNTITGGAGNDLLDGGAGNDTLDGGAGNDIYVVDSASDVIKEAVSAGTDEIRTALAAYSIAALVNVENLTYTGSANFTGTGNAFANTITGGGGNDLLNGGGGADTLIGGAGSDIYIVDHVGDIVTEAADAGNDTVRTTLASYTLGSDVENLTNIGTAAFTGTGNTLNNILTGGAGVDTLKGGAGDDTYVISTGDTVIENADEGIDTVQTNLAAYTLGVNVENLTSTGTAVFAGTGNALDNVLKGGVAADKLVGAGGNDTLIGGAGADTMSGGTGDDIYVVDIATDIVIENANEGTDTVRTALVSYTLGNNVENLTYTGSASFTGAGNALANTITGGAGNDVLNGGTGADSLIGGAGNDTYIVDNAGDIVTEIANEGVDTVRTSLASYTLAANVENLSFAGTGTFAGTGNNLDNTITGGAATDTLSGGAGNDTLDGGAGADTLIGGAGSDIYIVDHVGDIVTEAADEGADTVRTALASYTLGSDLENLTYIGTVAFTGTGNDLANTIRGAAGADTLDGKAGADSLIGGAGNDTYIVDDVGDVVTEGLNAGTDLIKTALSIYTLASNVENLLYTGSASFTGTGNTLVNTITGGAGNDLLDGGAGNDTLDGGAGNDIYVVDSASDVIKEAVSAGTDEIRTALAAYSIAALVNVENLTYTGSANFTGTGNAFANTITGGGGNDLLNGGGGADTLIGGAGSDIYIVDHVGDIVTEAADAGNDTVRTTLASYTLGSDVENLTNIGTAAFTGTGNTLNNILTGGAGVDTLKGGAGDDTYVISTGDTVIENADEGIDTVQTNLAAYTLGVNVENLTSTGTAVFAGTGNALDNVLKGGVAADKLVGAGGNDTLIGGAGADTMSGGTGDDIYVVDIATDIVIENANEGTDTVRTALVSYTLGNNVENLTYTGSASFTGAGNALANTITGGAGNDVLNGGTGADSLIGGAGNDTYIVDNAGDIVTEIANEGVDTVRTSLASYTLAANVENLSFAGTGTFAGTGNNLDNTITGGAATDTLSGGAGNDTLDGGAGADTLIGGAGSDIYIVDHVGDIVTEAADEGADTVRTALASYTLGSDLENLTYIGTVAFTGTGNDLANTIRGAAGADTLDGKAGADSLIGGAGNDTYIVDDVGDVVTEGLNAGTDLIKTALSIYTLASNVENLLYTGSASFTGTGNTLVNTITGGAGNDLLDGGAGNDTLDGGAGNDIYVVDSASDVIKEAVSAGTDEIRTALAAYSIAALVNVENLTYTGSANFTGTGNAFANTITGGGGNDLLNGGGGADTLIGGAGSDIYIVDHVGDIVTEAADAGNDTVRTTLASYTLGSDVENLTNIGTAAFTGTGNTLNNILTGGAGVDTLKGGAGDDTYVISTGDTVIENADEGIDTVQTNLAAYTLGVNVENLTSTGTAVFAGTGNALDNVLKGGVAADKLVGAGGNDTLIGGAGADTMSGGTGDDIYVVDIATDIVIENANEGTDTVRTALVSYTLGNNVENLTYTGSASFTGAGNALANTITGGAGNDVLNGGTGADSLIGGAGNDTYIVDNAGDIVTEIANEGVDTVRTSLASYTLAANVENLTYIGTGPFAGTGNALNNVIVGGSGSNTLMGGAGNDTLTGGAAADVFVFLLNWGHDTITNFVATGSAHDTIRIDHSIFADWESLFAASSQYGNDTIVTADIDNTIVLRNVALTSLDSGDFFFA
ncbi:M10 family metallopeptidase [Rhizobium sp. SU303]|uniref:M10 family metallopeptidase n=1 Tax=Rhizobium sp. SU303 TaxID=3138065 RepID=UPI001E567448|nr:M10 family metallopeptidase [Rhizobium leguminosarum]UFW78748.1 M10 family metallopeptidase C-terminal domain-containing protein [Rhizobium leguminosarum bv. viciae]